ncbi:hypothetical protein SAMN05421767_1585 [Granulicatella balaenopterae]|uniref:Uncharacterized protein n=1 Tax=Granulicatella balaenopterae TaxID=137733 RepID=A0A1H9PHC5_9LACT|nr:hypothetical protein [Granulicatella balaenopterae]SER47265.1 hypothetical protein SAMN05421767_1585 [Granulicatella balaenopterae]
MKEAYIVLTNRGFVKEIIYDLNPYKDKDMPSKRYRFTTYKEYAKQFTKQSEAIECATFFDGQVQSIQSNDSQNIRGNALKPQYEELQKSVLEYLYSQEIKIKDFNKLANITDAQSYMFRQGQQVKKEVIQKIKIFIQNVQ